MEEVREVKEEIGKIRELAFRPKFSLSFVQSFEKAFRCSICPVTPAKLPLIACLALYSDVKVAPILGTKKGLIKNVSTAILHEDCLNCSF